MTHPQPLVTFSLVSERQAELKTLKAEVLVAANQLVVVLERLETMQAEAGTWAGFSSRSC